MNTSIFNAYSNIYSAALMHNMKPTERVAVQNNTCVGRFSTLVKLLRRA